MTQQSKFNLEEMINNLLLHYFHGLIATKMNNKVTQLFFLYHDIWSLYMLRTFSYH